MSFDPLTMDTPIHDAQFPPSLQLLAFTSEGAHLNGRMFMAGGAGVHSTILLLHGFPGVEQNQDLAHICCRLGWHVVMFHYRGAWGSHGVFSVANVLEDVANVYQQIIAPAFAEKYRIDTDKVVVMGHSMGGFTALHVAARFPNIYGAVSLAGFNFGGHGKLLEEADVEDEGALWQMEAAPLTGASGVGVVREMMSYAEVWDVSSFAKAFANRYVYLMGASEDFVAPNKLHHTDVAEAFTKSGVKLTQTIIQGADHSFTAHRITLARHVLDWLKTL
jgi:uncharacterized protein